MPLSPAWTCGTCCASWGPTRVRPAATPAATHLGYLRHKNPPNLQTFEMSFGKVHVFYPEATPERCTAALLHDVDRVGLVRNRKGPLGEGFALEQYVSDRPYAASSFPSVAIARILGSPLAGRSRGRQELADAPMPLVAKIATRTRACCTRPCGQRRVLKLSTRGRARLTSGTTSSTCIRVSPNSERVFAFWYHAQQQTALNIGGWPTMTLNLRKPQALGGVGRLAWGKTWTSCSSILGRAIEAIEGPSLGASG